MLVGALAFAIVGCSSTVPGGKSVTTPTPATVIGPVPRPTVGNPVIGKQVFLKTSCGTCHTFTPAGTSGKVGPNLDNLAEQAKVANQGTLEQFTTTSIVNPTAYIAPGYPSGVMPANYAQKLTPTAINDLVAFLVKGP